MLAANWRTHTCRNCQGWTAAYSCSTRSVLRKWVDKVQVLYSTEDIVNIRGFNSSFVHGHSATMACLAHRTAIARRNEASQMFESLLQELVGGAHGIQERAEGIAFLKMAGSVYPLTTTSYLGLNIPLGTGRTRFVQCTYSDAWVKHCVSREPLSVNRLATLTPALSAPLDWSELPDNPDTHELLRCAHACKGSTQLLSLPLRPLVGETALFFVAAEMEKETWQAQKKTLLREFQVLASYFHQHILRIYGHDAESQILVSARELDCLKWVAAGKTAWEASVILGISERTVRFHLNAAREKLNCLTTTQAVAKAVSQQLIEC